MHKTTNRAYQSSSLALTLFLFFVAMSCSESHQERLQRLEEMIARGEAAQAIREINEHLGQQNTIASEVIDENPSNRLLKNSLDGRMAAWLVKDDLHFISGGNRDSVGLDGQPLDFSLSYSGNYALVLTRVKEECIYQIIDIREPGLVDTELPSADCKKIPLITDDGRFIYGITSQGITPRRIGKDGNDALNLGEGQALQPSLPVNMALKKFPANYKKIKNRFELFQVQSRGYVAFRGSAGYYQIYQYPGSGEKLQTVKASFARAALYSVYDGDTLPVPEDLPEEEVQSDDEDNEDKQEQNQAQVNRDAVADRAPGNYLFQKAHAFAYTGSAGKRRMRALHFGDRIRLGTSFSAPVWQKLQFIRDREEFMVLTNERLYYWNPITRKKAQLPLVARDFVLFDGGLLYVDLTNRLYLRKKAFSPAELDLVRLRRKALDAQETQQAREKITPE